MQTFFVVVAAFLVSSAFAQGPYGPAGGHGTNMGYGGGNSGPSMIPQGGYGPVEEFNPNLPQYESASGGYGGPQPLAPIQTPYGQQPQPLQTPYGPKPVPQPQQQGGYGNNNPMMSPFGGMAPHQQLNNFEGHGFEGFRESNDESIATTHASGSTASSPGPH